MKHLMKEDNFNDVIKEGTWLVDFSASWCGPCRMLEPNLVEVAKDNNVLAIDIDMYPELTESFGIMSVPTLILFKDGNKVSQTVGYKSVDELRELLK